MSEINQVSQPSRANWRALQYFNFYRLLVALFFCTLAWTESLPEPIGVDDQKLFTTVVHLYLLVAFIFIFVIKARRPGYRIQTFLNVVFDIIAIILMMFASHGLSSGFGMLLVITVAGGSILVNGKIAILFASIASLSVLGLELYQQLSRYYFEPNYTHAGFLGVTFFTTAFLSHVLASRAEQSEELAEQRAIDLQHMARLNEDIVQRMQSGIVVLDSNLVIRLINNSAMFMLATTKKSIGSHIRSVSQEIASVLENWSQDSNMNSFEVCQGSSNLDLKVAISDLGEAEHGRILLYLDEIAVLRQQAQSLKLASLGRLTASIAHEIRNPLGAISHAGQLLSESDNIRAEDERLMQIIRDQSSRLNSIIENVLSISRRKLPTPSGVRIKPWLEKFADELVDKHQLPAGSIVIEVEPETLEIKMDSTQLHQVIWNLGENAVRYSRGDFVLKFICSKHSDSGRPFVDIIDTGPGLPEEVSKHLFEPFVTTEAKGTGLGLYIARELCEANQATLSVYLNSDKGCHFRINFPYTEKTDRLNS